MKGRIYSILKVSDLNLFAPTPFIFALPSCKTLHRPLNIPLFGVVVMGNLGMAEKGTYFTSELENCGLGTCKAAAEAMWPGMRASLLKTGSDEKS